MHERRFEPLGGKTVYDGSFISLRLERFRYPDGEEVERAIVRHPGAVGVVAHDGEDLILVRQPREATGDPDSLEVPAGKLDPGEQPLETGQRELAEEVGLAAATWEHLITYWSSPGVFDESVHVYLATDLSPAAEHAVDEEERIEIVRWPLADLDGAIAATSDAKTLIGLMLLRQRSTPGPGVDTRYPGG